MIALDDAADYLDAVRLSAELRAAVIPGCRECEPAAQAHRREIQALRVAAAEVRGIALPDLQGVNLPGLKGGQQ